MEPLLVGVDGSEDARAALRWAAVVAERLELPLRALWAWHYASDTTLRLGRTDLRTPPGPRADWQQLHQLVHGRPR